MNLPPFQGSVLSVLIIVLMMEAVQTSETVVNSCQYTWCYSPEDSHLQNEGVLRNSYLNLTENVNMKTFVQRLWQEISKISRN
jgi:hypothetical protein